MANSESLDGYLPPSEQMIIAAKVNRICGLEPDESAPFPLVTDAQDIVRALHDRLKNSGRIRFNGIIQEKDKSQVLSADTGIGNVSASFDRNEKKQYRMGVKEYRIGGYVATKMRLGRNIFEITFEPFFGRGEVNAVFDNFPESTSIVYSPDRFVVRGITRSYPKISAIHLGILHLGIQGEENVEMWTNSFAHKRRPRQRQKNLLYKGREIRSDDRVRSA